MHKAMVSGPQTSMCTHSAGLNATSTASISGTMMCPTAKMVK
jgi:hypothetical protein